MAIYLAFSILIFISIARGNSKSFNKYLTLAASCLLALSSIIVILINVVLLFKLNPPLQTPIMPSNIHMGFISERETNNMKVMNVEFVGQLSDLLESKNKTIGHENYLGLQKFYWRTYRVNIECPSRFYQDCNSHNAANLTIDITYLEAYFSDDSQELILTKSYARSYNFLFENLDKNRKILTFLSKILYGNLSQIL